MKKYCIFILIIFLLCAACQPTPEMEFVVNKGDDMVEDKLSSPLENEAPEEGGTVSLKQQIFPERWDEGPIIVNDRLTLTFQAEVIQKADGLYPVYRTRQHLLTHEEIIELVERILPTPVAETKVMDTKADWSKAYQDWLDDLAEYQAWVAAGKPNDGVDRDDMIMSPEEIDRISREYQRLIAEAPEELESTPVSDYSGLKLNEGTHMYTFADGTKASVITCANSVSVFKGCSHAGYIYFQYTHEREKELGDVKPFLTVKMSREAAEKTLYMELDRLGFGNFSVFRAAPANLCSVGRSDMDRPLSAGWGFQLRRNNGDYPLSTVSFMDSRALVYGDEDAFAYNRPIPNEMIEVFIDENGLQALHYMDPKTVVARESDNVELLPFEQVQMRIKNALIVGVGTNLDQPIPCNVYRLLLTSCTIRVKDSDDLYEMPCWVVFFTWNDAQASLRDNPQVQQEALIINAVDGSIVHAEFGY